jgi:effector-binding domain-containing protein
MSYRCEMMRLPEHPALTIRKRSAATNLNQCIGEALDAIATYLAGLEEPAAGPPFVAYFNQDMADFELEIGFPVTRPLPGQGDILAGHGPSGRAATCLYVGGWDGLGGAYDELTRRAREKGVETTGLAYEVYLTGPDTPQPDQQTRIIFPVKE